MNDAKMAGPAAGPDTQPRGGLRSALSSCSSAVRRNLHNFRYGVNRYYLQNPASRRQFAAQSPQLSPVQKRAVEALRVDGIATINIEELFGAAHLNVLLEQANTFAESARVKDAERQFRTGERRNVAKEFIVKWYEPRQRRTSSDPLFRFGLRPELLDIVNSFAGLWTRYYDVEMLYNIPTGAPAARTQSQNWHRDFTDEPTIKAFLYYRDVDEGAGPLEYIPGSRRNGKYAHVWRQPGWTLSEGYYPPSEKIDELIPAEDRRVCCVPARTLVICDTSGFHRGGYAVSNPRIASVWTYLTPASLEKRLFDFESGPWLDQLDSAARFALG